MPEQEQNIIVDLYLRVSGDKQEDNTSLDEQEENGRKFVEEKGLTIGLVHREVGSGYTLNRKKLKLMQERYKSGTIQGVVIWKIGRLARKQEFINYLMVEMELHGCQMFCVKTPLNKDDQDYQLQLFMETFFADRERKEIVEKLAAGRVRSIKEHKNYGTNGNNPLYGYDWIKERRGRLVKKVGFTINPEKAEHVLHVFTLFDSGAGTTFILNEMRKIAPEKDWNIPNIKKMLADIRYTGKGARAFTRKLASTSFSFDAIDLPDGTYPQIISDELFGRVQERLKIYAMDAPKRNSHPEMYLLRGGFVFCSICGRPMTCHTKTETDKKFLLVYACRNYGHVLGISSSKLDREVWAFIEEIAKESPLIKQAIEKALKQDTMSEVMEGIELSIQEHQKKLDLWQDDLDNQRVPENLRAFLYSKMSIEQETIRLLQENQKDSEKQKGQIEKRKEVLHRIYQWYEKIYNGIEGEPMSYDEKREFMRMIGLKITVLEFQDLKSKRWNTQARNLATDGLHIPAVTMTNKRK